MDYGAGLRDQGVAFADAGVARLEIVHIIALAGVAHWQAEAGAHKPGQFARVAADLFPSLRIPDGGANVQSKNLPLESGIRDPTVIVFHARATDLEIDRAGS